MLANVLHELEVLVLHELLAHALGDGLAESSLVLDVGVLAIDGLPELLVVLSRHEVGDLRDLEREVARVVCQLVLLDLQQGCHLAIALRIGVAGIEGDDVAELCALEEVALGLHLDL